MSLGKKAGSEWTGAGFENNDVKGIIKILFEIKTFVYLLKVAP